MPASCERTVATTMGCTVPMACKVTGTSIDVACAVPTAAAGRPLATVALRISGEVPRCPSHHCQQ